MQGMPQETPVRGGRSAPCRRLRDGKDGRQDRPRTGDTGDAGNNAATSFRGSKPLGLLRERPHDNDL